MTVPSLAVHRSASLTAALSVEADVLVIGVLQSPDGPELAALSDDLPDLAAALGAIGFRGAADEVRRLPGTGVAAKAIAIVGLGTATITAERLRYAAGTVARQLTGIQSVAVALPLTGTGELDAVLEGLAIGSHEFVAYKSAPAARTRRATSFTVVTDLDEHTGLDVDAAIERATAVADAVHQVRDLVSMPALDLYPQSFADLAELATVGTDVTLEVLDESALAAAGFGGILGVGQGSSRGPRLVKAVWSPEGATKHIALVGKGITFDTGGLSLKPAASMVGMKDDMAGAATALAVVIAAARLGLPVKISAWLCLAENMPSGTAIRPGDVVTIYGGRTVEVLNTDAEGRLVMADGLAAASEEHPDALIDVATLTGAAVVAMGHRTVAAMGDTALVGRIVDAAGEVGEPFWPMPLPAELRSMLDSDIADLQNVKIGNTAGGMLVAGLFLKEFVGTHDDGTSVAWAHLDIAGPAYNTAGEYGFTARGATGTAVRTLLALAEGFSRE